MIIMVNGPFGVGKSTAAERLQKQLPNAMIYDPEITGAALRAWTDGIRSSDEETDDFQDIALWPRLTVLLAAELYQHYRRDLIVPMTIVHPDYYHTITSGLRAIAPPLYHFCLLASPATVYARLEGRDASTGWAWRKSQQYLPRFSDPRFQIHIDTEQQSPDAIAQFIVRHVHAAS